MTLLDPSLEAFVAAADEGSFAKAGRRLYMSSTAVMKNVNALEERLGVALLERSNRGVGLTAAGEALREGARRMEEEAVAAVGRARAAGGGTRTLRIGVSTLYPASFVARLRGILGDEASDLRVVLVPFDGPIVDHLGDFGTRFDAVLGITDSRRVHEACGFLRLGESRYCVALPWSHPLASRDSLCLADLEGTRLMVMEPGSSPVNDALRGLIESQYPGIEVVDVQQHYDIELFNRCAQEGCALLNLDVWSDVHPGLRSVPLDVDFAIPMGIIYPKADDPVIDGIVDRLRGRHSVPDV